MSPTNFILFHVFLIFFSIMRSNGEPSLFNSKSLCHALKHDFKEESVTDKSDKVNIQLYYETLCGGCSDFDTYNFIPVVQKLNGYLKVKTYPYGNAETIEQNGKYTFRCQHGPKECYGNMLHACALDIVKNQTQALMYNSCMMDRTQSNGISDDTAAKKCGSSMSIDSKPIIACASSVKGTKLLKQYGDESKKANVPYVPYVLVNGKEGLSNDFMKTVCAAFRNPPPPCTRFVI